MTPKALAVFLSAALFASASAPLGSISAAGAFKVNSTDIPATAASWLPVNTGDKITTADSQAVLRLDADQGVLTFGPKSVIETGMMEGVPFVRLVSGSLHYKLSASNKVIILKNAHRVPAGALQGSISTGIHATSPVVLAAVGGAAAVGTTVALVKRSKSCPDSNPNCNQ
jgi:hypothetical protein